MEKLKSKLKFLPDKPGVYIFKDKDDKVIYVGKAKSLKKRVSSYFRKFPEDAKVESIQQNAEDLEYIVTQSELEAIMLESNFIKKYRPRYNVILRDDKQYPYIKVTTNEKWPRVFLVRKIEDDGAKYFGPYSSAMVKESIRTLKRLFPIRWCKESPLKMRKQPCMYFHIKRCAGPCVGGVDHAGYMDMIAGVVDMLRGNLDSLVKRLGDDMENASSAREFEKAAALRDRIRTLKKMSQRQTVISRDMADRDVIGFVRADGSACVVVLQIREGKLTGRDFFFPYEAAGWSEEEFFEAVVRQYYSDAAYTPPEVVIGQRVSEGKLLRQFLSKRRGARVEFAVPSRGKKLSMVKMAEDNAKLLLERKIFSGGGEMLQSVSQLKEGLNLEALPIRIEAFDISNIQGTDTVGSMVSFVGGEPHKSDYRKFIVRTVKSPNDVAAIHEIVKRRYSGTLRDTMAMPDLIVVDGGIAQANSAKRALVESGLKNIPVFGLAKRLEEIFAPGRSSPIRLPREGAALKLLQRIRDEAHRFAITFHRAKRGRRIVPPGA